MPISDRPLDVDSGRRLIIREKNGFRLEHSSSIGICGYLILSPIAPADRFSDLSSSVLSALGGELAFATDLIQRHTAAERVYCLSFGEEVSNIHFHLLPRTRVILNNFLKNSGQAGHIANGALLFDWARETFKSDNLRNADIINAVERMRIE
ncbi:hypothetical protein [Burkholderia sp. BCC1630]|uniref:hypothetical protein n=1 Tax=Burkholderia sp. BCC1630 TaxID=2676304 RepID=UPI001588E1B2|nr:hypothetical protein [Burkholderia sp. BCC1630]